MELAPSVAHLLVGGEERTVPVEEVPHGSLLAVRPGERLFVVLAPFGLVTLIVAVAADMGISLLVTLNGLRLMRMRTSTA